MASKIDNALSFQQQVLGLRAQRQQILAGNIANADTPHYQARDFDFATALKEAVAGRSSGNLALTMLSALARLLATALRRIDCAESALPAI